jgi:hypothetical protein
MCLSQERPTITETSKIFTISSRGRRGKNYTFFLENTPLSSYKALLTSNCMSGFIFPLSTQSITRSRFSTQISKTCQLLWSLEWTCCTSTSRTCRKAAKITSIPSSFPNTLEASTRNILAHSLR